MYVCWVPVCVHVTHFCHVWHTPILCGILTWHTLLRRHAPHTHTHTRRYPYRIVYVNAAWTALCGNSALYVCNNVCANKYVSVVQIRHSCLHAHAYAPAHTHAPSSLLRMHTCVCGPCLLLLGLRVGLWTMIDELLIGQLEFPEYAGQAAGCGVWCCGLAWRGVVCGVV